MTSVFHKINRFLGFVLTEPLFFIKLLKIKWHKNVDSFLFGVPTHGNLGDHLIAQSEIDFLKSTMRCKTIELSLNFAHYFKGFLKKNIKTTDIIFISGGGWLGSKWVDDEMFVRNVVSSYPSNLIVIFPQTVFYETLDSFFEAGKKIYSSHERLIFCLREETSYTFVCENKFTCNASTPLLLPDFGLLLDIDSYLKRKKHKKTIAGLCFRDDCEKQIDSNRLNNVKNEIPIPVETFTTNIKNKLIPLYLRKNNLRKIIKKISSYEIVVTDRLHAMVISYLCNTPVIAFDNATKKVSGVHKWINVSSCVLLEESDCFSTACNSLLKATERVETRFDRLSYLNILKREIEKKRV